MRIRVIDVLDLFAEELPDLETEDLKASLQYAARKLDHPVLAMKIWVDAQMSPAIATGISSNCDDCGSNS